MESLAYESADRARTPDPSVQHDTRVYPPMASTCANVGVEEALLVVMKDVVEARVVDEMLDTVDTVGDPTVDVEDEAPDELPPPEQAPVPLQAIQVPARFVAALKPSEMASAPVPLITSILAA